MGCGASKSPQSAVVPQAKSQTLQAAAPPKAADGGLAKSANVKVDNAPALIKASSLKTGGGAGPADPPESKCAGKEEPQRTSSIPIDSSSRRPESASQNGIFDRPGSGRGQEDPARAAFRSRALGSGAAGEDSTPSPTAFKSSRSLNRSIGVRRRESDSGSDRMKASGLALKASPLDDDDDVAQSPDSLVERFERTKGVNPLLRKVTANGMSGRHSEKSALKSQKRLMFADEPKDAARDGEGEGDIKGGGDSLGATVRARGDSASEAEDIDPEQHIEAERQAAVAAQSDEAARPGQMGPAPVGVAPAEQAVAG